MPSKIEQNSHPIDYFDSLAYIDDPNIVFKHPKGEFYLSASTDYKHVTLALDDPASNVLPFYIPRLALDAMRPTPYPGQLDLELVDTLKTDYLNYAHQKGIFTEKEIRNVMNFIPGLAMYSSVPNQLRLISAKAILWLFIFDDVLEVMASEHMLADVAELYVENCQKIVEHRREQLKPFTESGNSSAERKCIEQAYRVQDMLAELIDECKVLMEPKPLDLFCQFLATSFDNYRLEAEIAGKKIEMKQMASLEERILVKHLATGQGYMFYPLLREKDIQFHPVGQYFSNLINMAECDDNDVFSYFKEAYQTKFPNVFNKVTILVHNGMDELGAFRETLRSRNELIRSMEIGLKNCPAEEAESLMKGFLSLVGAAHFGFINPRYGWLSTTRRRA